MKVGRPLKFKTKEELDKAINSYFENTPKDEWTWTGLALYLDTSRQTLLNYEEIPEYVDSIKKGLSMVENGYEIDLKKYGRSGTIFALKNFDWKDKNETDLTTAGEKINMNIINYAQDNNNTSQLPTEELSNTIPDKQEEVQDTSSTQEVGQEQDSVEPTDNQNPTE